MKFKKNFEKPNRNKKELSKRKKRKTGREKIRSNKKKIQCGQPVYWSVHILPYLTDICQARVHRSVLIWKLL